MLVFVACVWIFCVVAILRIYYFSEDGSVIKHIDQLLTTINIFSTVSANNCRARLCLLGETMVTTLIQLLGNRTQPSKVKVIGNYA